ncbi:MAG: N,N-dimethylformamidase beta subunit family domain-containing protein, partial [Opitutaceae bacterium]
MKRRDFITTPLATGALLAASQLPTLGAAADAANQPQPAGTTDWQLTNIKADAGRWPPANDKGNPGGTPKRSKAIEGYCRQQSVEAGQKLEICVSTQPARRFTIDIYRMGYYGGSGGRLVRTIGPMKGSPQPEPPVGEMRLRECRWAPSVSLEIPPDWRSGIYLGKLACVPETRNEHAWQNYVIFIVRDRRKADIVYQASDNTWAAYNRWPDLYSLYTDPRGGMAFDVAVSFDRPCTKDPHIFSHPLSLGSGHFFLWEFPLVYWLEQHGYDVTYVSNSDMIDPAQIERGRVFVSSGHDEYWDLRQYENALASIARGTTHLYLCGNAVSGLTPFSSSTDGRSNRIITRKGSY